MTLWEVVQVLLFILKWLNIAQNVSGTLWMCHLKSGYVDHLDVKPYLSIVEVRH